MAWFSCLASKKYKKSIFFYYLSLLTVELPAIFRLVLAPVRLETTSRPLEIYPQHSTSHRVPHHGHHRKEEKKMTPPSALLPLLFLALGGSTARAQEDSDSNQVTSTSSKVWAAVALYPAWRDDAVPAKPEPGPDAQRRAAAVPPGPGVSRALPRAVDDYGQECVIVRRRRSPGPVAERD